MTHNELVKRWRKIRATHQRLYFRSSGKLRDYFDRDVVAVIRSRTSAHMFTSWAALEEYIIEGEQFLRERP